VLLFVILAVSALAFANAIDGQFVYDDRLQVLKNPTLNSLSNIPKMFTQGVWQFLSETDKTAVGPYYRPIFNIALIVNRHLFGLEVAGWHIVSIALHLAWYFSSTGSLASGNFPSKLLLRRRCCLACILCIANRSPGFGSARSTGSAFHTFISIAL
jgi:hypothetical protein